MLVKPRTSTISTKGGVCWTDLKNQNRSVLVHKPAFLTSFLRLHFLACEYSSRCRGFHFPAPYVFLLSVVKRLEGYI